MAKYELTVVFDSLQKEEEMQEIISKTENFIKNNGGEVHNIDDWGKKRLAYEINRKQYGNYYQLFFEAPTSLPALLDKELRLEDSVLRSMTLTAEYDPADFTEEKEESDATSEKPEGEEEQSETTKSEQASDSEESSDSEETPKKEVTSEG